MCAFCKCVYVWVVDKVTWHILQHLVTTLKINQTLVEIFKLRLYPSCLNSWYTRYRCSWRRPTFSMSLQFLLHCNHCLFIQLSGWTRFCPFWLYSAFQLLSLPSVCSFLLYCHYSTKFWKSVKVPCFLDLQVMDIYLKQCCLKRKGFINIDFTKVFGVQYCKHWSKTVWTLSPSFWEMYFFWSYLTHYWHLMATC